MRSPQVSELLAGRVADLIAEGDVEHLRLLTLTRRGRDLLKDRARGTGAQAIHAAAAHNRPDIMELLLGAGATLHDAAYERMTPLMFAAAAGSHEALRWILGRSRIEAFHIDALGRSAVHHAAAGGSAACLSALLEARAPRHDAPDGTPDRKRPIEYAREGGHTECVAVLEQWAASA